MQDLGTFVPRQLERFKVPGVALGIVRDGEVVHAAGYGERDATTQRPVTTETIFAIGSATKAFTAALVGALVEDGLLDWDVPVREYLPWFRMFDPIASESVSVRDLLSHRTGLPRHDLVWYGDPPISRAEMVARVRHLPPNKGFRQTWQYNNLGYVTAGFLAGELLGGTWEDAVDKRLLEPMKMHATNVSVHESQRVVDHSLPHDERDGVVQPIPFRVIDRVGPAGSINSTLDDMLSFLMANVCDGRLGGQQVMSAATMREMHTPQMVIPVESFFEEVSDDAYGLGWFIGTYRDHRIIHHGGNIDGFTALMTLLPEARAGLVILANRGATSLPKMLQYTLYDDILGLEPLDWPERYAGIQEAMRSGGKEARERARARYATGTTPSHPLADYTGDFVHPGYGTMSFALSQSGTALIPSYNGLDLTLQHRHYDVFELIVNGREEVRAPVIFATDAEGEIASASIQTEGSVPPLVFARAPDPALSDPEFLARAAGTYARGPMRVSVERRGDGKLVLTLPSLPPSEMEPYLGGRFRLTDIPGVKVEFVLADDARIEQLIIHGIGTFTPVQ